MICRDCESTETRVVASEQRGGLIARRRQCCACGARWTTHEIHEQELSVLQRAAAVLRSLGATFKELTNGTT